MVNKQSKKKSTPIADSLCEAQVTGTLILSDVAAKKMIYLVMACPKEVGWHGIVEKWGKGDYYLKDIILYPQKTTSATIECDIEEYGLWQQKLCLESPEYFETIRLHGHSHVNMQCYPSSVDRDLQDDGIEMLQENGFYIWMIVNKRLDTWTKIADREDGVIYDEVDIMFDDEAYSQILYEYIKNVNAEGGKENGYE